jgi:hypothetical protein
VIVVHVKRLHLDASAEDPKVPKEVFVADCCLAYDTRCPVRGGNEACEAMFHYDTDVMEGGEQGMLVCCVCACHRKPAEA